MASRAVKLTISVPRDLLAIADEIAKEKKVSRSKLMSFCLQELAKQRLQKNMIEGYRALAKDNMEFADCTAETACEVLPEWRE